MNGRPIPLSEKINPVKSALLVIDLQNDYAHEDGAYGKAGLSVKMAKRIVSPINRVIEVARQAGVIVIFTRNWKTSESTSEAMQDRDARSIVGPSGLAETWGARWYGVEPSKSDLIINKTRYDAFIGTNLEQILRSNKIETLIFTGINTNVCVESTARSAYMRDFYVVVLEDATAAAREEMHRASLRNIASYFGVVVAADDVLDVWLD